MNLVGIKCFPKMSTTSEQDYTLNVEKALMKKLEATYREKMVCEMKSGNLVVTLSPAVFDIVSNNVRNIECSGEWEMCFQAKTDRSDNCVEEIAKIMRNNDKMCTINLYRTTSKVMVNGKGTHEFSSIFIPQLCDIIDKNFKEISNKDSKLSDTIKKSVIPKRTSARKKTRTAKMKELDGVDMGNDTETPSVVEVLDEYVYREETDHISPGAVDVGSGPQCVPCKIVAEKVVEVIVEENSGNFNQDKRIDEHLKKLHTMELNNKKLKEEVDSLKSKVKSREALVEGTKSIEEKLKNVTKIRDQMNTAIQKLKQENSTLNSRLVTCQSVNESRQEIIESYTIVISGLEDKVREKDRIISELQVKVVTHKDLAFSFMDGLDESIHSHSSESDASVVHDLISQFKDQVELNEYQADKDSAIESMRKKNEELETSISKHANDVKRLEKSLLTKNTEIGQLKDVVSTLENEKCGLNNEVSVLKKEITTLKAQHETSMSLEQTVQEYEINVASLVRESQNQKLSFEAELKTLQDVVSTLENEKCELNKVVSALKEETTALQETHTSIGLTVQEYESKIVTLQDINGDLNKLNKSLEKELNEHKEKCIISQSQCPRTSQEQCTVQIISLTKVIEDQKLAFAKELQALKTLISEDSTLRDKVDIVSQLKSIIESKTKDNTDLREHCRFADQTDLENQVKIKELYAAVDSKQVEIDRLMSKLKESEAKINEVSMKVREKSAKIESCQEQITQLSLLNRLIQGNRSFDVDEGANQSPRKNSTNSGPQSLENGINQSPNKNSANPGPLSLDECCFHELKVKGSCNDNRCRFSHQIPEQLYKDKKEIDAFIKMKTICINEFKCSGSCHKKSQCKFDHSITEEDRRNPCLIQRVEYILNRIRSKVVCRYETARKGSCRNGSNCLFSHSIKSQSNRIIVDHNVPQFKPFTLNP